MRNYEYKTNSFIPHASIFAIRAETEIEITFSFLASPERNNDCTTTNCTILLHCTILYYTILTFDDVGMLERGQKLGLDDEIGGTRDEPTGIVDRVDRQEFHGVPTVLRRFPKDVLRYKGPVLLLEGTRNFLGVLGLLQVANDLDGLDLVHVVEATRAEKVAQNDLRSLEAGDAFFQGRVDDSGVLAHVLGRTASGLPGLAADVLDLGLVHVFAGVHFVGVVLCCIVLYCIVVLYCILLVSCIVGYSVELCCSVLLY